MTVVYWTTCGRTTEALVGGQGQKQQTEKTAHRNGWEPRLGRLKMNYYKTYEIWGCWRRPGSSVTCPSGIIRNCPTIKYKKNVEHHHKPRMSDEIQDGYGFGKTLTLFATCRKKLRETSAKIVALTSRIQSLRWFTLFRGSPLLQLAINFCSIACLEFWHNTSRQEWRYHGIQIVEFCSLMLRRLPPSVRCC